jgi:hypothetical protein
MGLVWSKLEPDMAEDDEIVLPDFDSLPKVEGMPQGCAWGIFDKDGKKDIFGTLNLLTPKVIKAAAAEIEYGESISLKYATSHFSLLGSVGHGSIERRNSNKIWNQLANFCA